MLQESSEQPSSEERLMEKPSSEQQLSEEQLLEQQLLKLEAQYPSSQSHSAHVPRADRRAEALVEEFLDQFCAEPAGASADLRQSRAAKRLELHATIDAHMELGSTEAHAVELTLLSCRRELEQRQAALRQTRATTDNAFAIKRSRRLALASFGAASAFILPSLLATGSLINYDFGQWLTVLLTIFLPVMAGLYVGLHAPTRPTRSFLRAVGLLAIPNLLQYIIWGSLQTFTMPLLAGLFFGTFHLIVSAAAGGMAAKLGSKVRSVIRQSEST